MSAQQNVIWTDGISSGNIDPYPRWWNILPHAVTSSELRFLVCVLAFPSCMKTQTAALGSEIPHQAVRQRAFSPKHHK